MKKKIQFTLNRKPTELEVDPNSTLLWVLRDNLDLTGAKYGCGTGDCGACTVIVDGQAVRSCNVTVGHVAGKEVTTIEGLAKDGKLHPVQKAFVEHDALQCGYCTPGMIMHAVAMLAKNPKPTRQEIITGMDTVLCRCGAHLRIIAAVETASKEMSGGK